MIEEIEIESVKNAEEMTEIQKETEIDIVIMIEEIEIEIDIVMIVIDEMKEAIEVLLTALIHLLPLTETTNEDTDLHHHQLLLHDIVNIDVLIDHLQVIEDLLEAQ
jgi:hypothetical protein